MTLVFEAERTLGTFNYDAAFDAASNEIVVLFGNSGAGKSLTLQFVAGLLRPARGRIVAGDKVVFDSAAKIDLPPQQRRAGYVVQELALFEHMTVGQNVAFGLPRGRDRTHRVAGLLALLDLAGFEERRPRSLSGGQRQRVALARALAREAPLLLLDEPFSALDDALRATMRRELLRLRGELGLTIVFVTHDLREAHLLADRIAVFDAGRMLQSGQPDTIFRRPASRRVAALTGVTNIWPGQVVAAGSGSVTVSVSGLALLCALPSAGRFRPDEAVDVAIRPERVVMHRGEPGEGGPRTNTVMAHLVEDLGYGSSHILRLQPERAGPLLEVEVSARPYEVLRVAERGAWVVELPPEDLHVMPAGV